MNGLPNATALNLPEGRAGRALAAGIGLILVLVVWFAIVAPLLGWYESRAEALQARAALLQREQALVATGPALEQAARRGAANAPGADAFLTGATGAIAGATLQQLLQGMTARGGVNLSSAEALTPAAEGTYQRIQLRVSVTGTWPALVKLFAAAAASRPAMLVDDLDVIGAQVAQGAVPPIDATFTVIAFRKAGGHLANAESSLSSTMPQ